MGYHTISPTDIAPFDAPGRDFRSISRALDLEHLGLNHITAAPGEQLPMHYHAHETQEEAFYVIEGTLHVETPDSEYIVETGSLFVVEPGNYHRGYNPKDAAGPLEVLAVGAPSGKDATVYESEGEE
ncbi:cupin domain-containing protein [Halobacteria archaeon AArc-curdl1]|uniref:Cupin domain-containing protein n=1 Tax=Natronosalvus hydrolyticus TaxID=2979988 RepID=A0AAP2ZC70_9EURY|nr:cupin domain-containing protein [Halobacteria archaeon AArc-curdl1]